MTDTIETFKIFFRTGEVMHFYTILARRDGTIEISDRTTGPAPEPIAAPGAKKKPCGGCNKGYRSRIHRWLGMRWYGKPKPLRLRVRRHIWPFYFQPLPGCGCTVRGKNVWLAIKGVGRAIFA